MVSVLHHYLFLMKFWIMKSNKIIISPDQIKRAKNLYEFNNIKNSISKGKSQIYGAIGEIVVWDWLCENGIETEYHGTKDYDLKSDIITIDVKTIRANVEPNNDHNANISAHNTKQNTFLYFWVYVLEDMKSAFLIGWLDKESFFEEATFNKKGNKDGLIWEFKSDTYSLKIKNLIPADDLISNLKQINMSATKKQYDEVREEIGIEFQPHLNYDKSSNLFSALSGFQQEVPVIHKATQGYGYTYADLSKIIQTINPILAKHGLGYTQPLMNNSIKTIIFHVETGETLESIIDIPQNVLLKGMNDFQILGSAISYLRRYSLASILTLITDADLDASGDQIKKVDSNITIGKPKINEKDFLKLCGAINAKKEHNGKIIDKDWALVNYALSKEQITTIEMLNN